MYVVFYSSKEENRDQSELVEAGQNFKKIAISASVVKTKRTNQEVKKNA